VTIALSVTIRPQFTVECLRRSSQQGHLDQNLGVKGSTDVSQSLTNLGDTWGCRVQKNLSISYAV